MATQMQKRYRVYMTPITDIIMGTYGDEIDVSDKIFISGVSSIRRSLDSADYGFGVFVFSDLTLKGSNKDGYFNDENDTRSIFKFSRDLCKVRVVFEEVEITRNSSGLVTGDTVTQTVTYRGLVNEEATRFNPADDSVSFKILSLDSVFRTTKVQGGSVATGSSPKTAMENILNQPKITSILGFSASNINPSLNTFTIDDGSAFDNRDVQDALSELLLISNSVLLIDSSQNIIVRSREEGTTNPILNLHGKSDMQGRENIIAMKNFNSGRHRSFTAVKVNNTEANNSAYVQTFGYRVKNISIDSITDATKEEEIAESLVDEFKHPKMEVEVVVPYALIKNSELLDRVSINYPLRMKKSEEGTFLPVVGVAKIGDALTPLPFTYGSIEIHRRYLFKIIEIGIDATKFIGTLKCRQTGTVYDDGIIDTPNNCFVDFAVIGVARICAGGDPCDTYNPSAVGAAQVGCTRIA